MGMATLAGRPFRLDPESVQWSFQSKVSDKPTVGGKVIQVYGTTISDMTVVGSFGRGGWRQQEEFLRRMKDLANLQAQAGKPARQPSRFVYPPKQWDFLVYLKSYAEPGRQRAVYHAPGIINPKWQLSLFIVEDNSGIKTVAQNAYIARLARGIGWKKTDFNGPSGDPAVYNALSGTQPGTGPGGAGQEASQDGNYHGMGNQGSDVEAWRGLVAQYFPANTDAMMCIMKYESGGNRFALNESGSSATGLFQVMASVWCEPNGIEQHHLYDAMTNVRIAKQIYDQQGYKAWPNTSRKCGLR